MSLLINFQEFSNYIYEIYQVQKYITRGDKSLSIFINKTIVRLLGSLVLNWYYRDREVVQSLFSFKAVFPKLDNLYQRLQFLANVLSVDGIIFTLYTFFKNANYINLVMKRIRSLLLPKIEDLTITAMKKCYIGQAQQTGHYIIQFRI